ncbi:MAG: iron-sulfur cluster insertion protein ErpA [Sulfobacillus sp.]|jgi:iron-sulfur cluster assembly accessory protein
MVTITEKAAEKVRDLMMEQGGAGKGLRVFVTGGGCAGYSYGMAFDERTADDSVAEAAGVQVLVDPESLPILNGATIDFIDELSGSGFTIENPNAVKTCGCGHSFTTDQEKAVSSHC